MGIEDYIRPAGSVDPEAILGNSGMVICEPIPIPKTGVLTCRRGQGSRTFQGQKPPTCEGLVKPRNGDWKSVILACEKCRLTHATVNKDGVMHYGAVL